MPFCGAETSLSTLWATWAQAVSSSVMYGDRLWTAQSVNIFQLRHFPLNNLLWPFQSLHCSLAGEWQGGKLLLRFR